MLIPIAIAFTGATIGSAQQSATRFTLQKVADGVYAAIRTEPPGLMFDANSIFLIGPDDVIVVDTNMTPSSARATLAALRTVTKNPVTTVVNTHWHDDPNLSATSPAAKRCGPPARTIAGSCCRPARRWSSRSAR
jgi:hypothetical protein